MSAIYWADAYLTEVQIRDTHVTALVLDRAATTMEQMRAFDVPAPIAAFLDYAKLRTFGVTVNDYRAVPLAGPGAHLPALATDASVRLREALIGQAEPAHVDGEVDSDWEEWLGRE